MPAPSKPSRLGSRSLPKPQVVRVVVSGRTCRRGQPDNRNKARAMLSDAFASDRWPNRFATITITPGGFVRSRLPRDYNGGRGWGSKKRDLRKLIPYAEEAVNAVLSGDVLRLARRRTSILTLGVDLNIERHKEERLRDDHRCRSTCPGACTHTELVAVVDTAVGGVVHWTGKSYPVEEQQHTLVHVEDLGSHLLKIGSERLVVLGCHDLLLFIDRGRQSGAENGRRRRRITRPGRARPRRSPAATDS